ncbi:MAG: 50S ribosomal protein L15 [Spirochaetia bacterium]|jgi:large subunit ribosomal protein L15|nr:50S ribosomal protein L15 [Spirochaetia bacterium]
MEQIKAPVGANRKKSIVGRGTASKGRTAGRGHDGQNSRSGGGTRPGFEGGQMPLYRRIAHRGFSNYPFKEIYTVINVSRLEEKYKDGDVVNEKSLREKDLLKGKNSHVKILGNGELNIKLDVQIKKITAGAREKIEKSGGKVMVKEGSDDQ